MNIIQNMILKLIEYLDLEQKIEIENYLNNIIRDEKNINNVYKDISYEDFMSHTWF